MELTNAVDDAVDSSLILESTAVDTLVGHRVSPGMLVLAPPMRLLHMNQHAWELLRRLSNGENREMGNGHTYQAKGLLPESLHETFPETFTSPAHRRHA